MVSLDLGLPPQKGDYSQALCMEFAAVIIPRSLITPVKRS